MRNAKNADLSLSIFIGWMMIGLVLTNAMTIIGERVHVSANQMSTANKVVLLVIFLRCLPILYRRFNIFMLIFVYLTAMLAIVNAMFDKNTTYFIPQLKTFILTIFPVALVCLAIKDYTVALKTMIWASYIIAGISTLVFAASITGRNAGFKYSMGYSTSLILPACCLLLDYLKNRRKIAFACAAAAALSAVTLGARGVILGIAAFFVIRILKFSGTDNSQKIKRILVISALLILLCFSRNILLFLSRNLAKLGVHSRSITMLLNDTWHMGGRYGLWSTIWDGFVSNPFAIRGISADFVILNGSYTHNIILELLYEGGLILGGFFLVLIGIKSVQTVTGKIDGDAEELLLLFFCSSVPRLFISGTLWGEVYFWCWFVMSCRLKSMRHRVNRGKSSCCTR